MLRILALVALLVLPTAASAHDFRSGDLIIIHPWARATPAGAKVAGGYLKIVNQGNAPDRLLAVKSAVAESVQLHSMSHENGVMKMAEIEGGVEIPAGHAVELKPMARHIMFMGLVAPFEENVMFDAELVFEKAGSVKVEFMVEAAGSEGKHH